MFTPEYGLKSFVHRTLALRLLIGGSLIAILLSMATYLTRYDNIGEAAIIHAVNSIERLRVRVRAIGAEPGNTPATAIQQALDEVPDYRVISRYGQFVYARFYTPDGATLAEELGTTVTEARSHRRGTPVGTFGVIPSLETSVFSSVAGTVVEPGDAGVGGVAVAKVISVTLADESELVNQLEDRFGPPLLQQVSRSCARQQPGQLGHHTDVGELRRGVAVTTAAPRSPGVELGNCPQLAFGVPGPLGLTGAAGREAHGHRPLGVGGDRRRRLANHPLGRQYFLG